jgi:hypothetical protein
MLVDIDFTNPYLEAFKRLLRNECNEVVTESNHKLRYLVDKFTISNALACYETKLVDDFSMINKYSADVVDILNIDDDVLLVYDDEIVNLIALAFFNSVSYLRLEKVKDNIQAETMGSVKIIATLNELYLVFNVGKLCNIYLITPNVKRH